MSSGTEWRAARSRLASSVALSSVYAECGATAGVIRASFLNRSMNRSARASASAGVFASATGNRMTVCPRTPRSPAALAVSAITSSK